MCRSTLEVPLIHAYVVPWGICLAAALALVVVLLAPRSNGVSAKGIVFGTALTIVAAVASGFIYQARSAHIATNGRDLTAFAMFVTFRAPLSTVAWQDKVDASDIHLRSRELGTSTGGVELGRFRMQNGREAFVLRTDKSSVLVPVRGSTDLILDRKLYDRFIACLKQRQ